jgi:hypothetical protein
MLPYADAPASVASHKRLVARVVSGVGSLYAPIREDQATANFEPLEREGVQRSARLVFLRDWLGSQLTAPCAKIDRYRSRQQEQDSFGRSRRTVRACRGLAGEAALYQRF